MFSEILFKIKKSKLLLGLLVICVIIFCVDIVGAVINIVQLIKVSGNSAKLMAGFYGFNIALIIINIVAVLMIFLALLLRKVCYIKTAKNPQKGR